MIVLVKSTSTEKRIYKMAANKKKKELPIIYPIFQEYMKCWDDEFWEGIFDRASRGKFLKNFSVKEGKMVKFNNGKLDEVELYEEPNYGAEQVVRFIQKYGYKSEEDKRLQEQEESNMRQNKIDDVVVWSSINGKPKKKKHFILQYVNDYQENHHLTDKQRDSYYSAINMGFHIGAINSSDVEFLDDKISTINGVYYNQIRDEYYVEEERKLKIELPEAKKKTNKKVKTCLDMWAEQLKKPSSTPTRKGMYVPSSVEEFNLKMQSRKNSPIGSGFATTAFTGTPSTGTVFTGFTGTPSPFRSGSSQNIIAPGNTTAIQFYT